MVVYIGQYAVKLPRWHVFRSAMRANRWEREIWRIWKPLFGWAHICPIIMADRFGLVVVMPRCMQPVNAAQIATVHEGYYPDVTSEMKADDHGYLGDRIVVLDYGLPLEEMVTNERARFRNLARSRTAA